MFEKMWTLTIAKIMYVLGIIVIIGIGIASISNAEQPLIGLSIIVFGNLIWRVIIEGIILVFSIHERLTQILEAMETTNNTNDTDDTNEERKANQNENLLDGNDV